MAEFDATEKTEMIMTNTFNMKPIGIATSCVFALGMAAAIISAKSQAADEAYLYDQSGAIVMSNAGLCWRTAFRDLEQ